MFCIHTLMTWKPIVLLALPSCLKALISGCIRLINATSACLLPVISNLICQRKQKENIKILLKLLNKTCLRNRTKLRFDILHSFMVCAQTCFLIIWIHQCFIGILLVYYRYFIGVLSVFYWCFIGILDATY